MGQLRRSKIILLALHICLNIVPMLGTARKQKDRNRNYKFLNDLPFRLFVAAPFVVQPQDISI